MDLGVDLTHNLSEILLLVREIAVVHLYHQQWPVFVFIDPFIVKAVKPFQVIEPDVLLVFTATFLDLVHQGWNRCLKVNKQIRRLNQWLQILKKGGVIFKITLGHEPHIKEVGRKNIGIFIDGPVLYYRLLAVPYFYQVLDPMIQKVYLQVKRPARHIFIKIHHIRLVLNILKMRFPLVMSGKHPRQCGFTRAYVPGNGNMFCGRFWRHMLEK